MCGPMRGGGLLVWALHVEGADCRLCHAPPSLAFLMPPLPPTRLDPPSKAPSPILGSIPHPPCPGSAPSQSVLKVVIDEAACLPCSPPHTPGSNEEMSDEAERLGMILEELGPMPLPGTAHCPYQARPTAPHVVGLHACGRAACIR